MKHTRMEKHEEKLKATIKRNKKIITLTTLVGLICPATLGTIQALADETAPTTEQTAEPVEQPVTEAITPEQPTETPSQEPVTPEPVETVTTEPEQTAPIERITEVALTEGATAQSPVTTEPVVAPQADLSAELAEWNNYFAQIIPLLDELESKVTGTSYQARYDELQNRFDFASFTGGQFPESTRDQAFYDQWLPELASILAGLQQLKSEVNAPPVQTGVFYDLVGDTAATVGETKTYTYNEVKFFSDGSMTETPVNIADTSYPLTSSNPSDVIVGGSITFGSEGTRTLVAKDNAGASLIVNVTKDSQEKTLTGIGFIPVIGMGVDGKLVPWSDFRVNLYYSDNTEEAVIPNATDYAFTTDNPNDVVTADGIIFNGVGNRVITVTHKGFTDKNGFVVVADQGLKEDDLKNAIKNGEDKISQGGWETTKDLEEAIKNGKDILTDDNRTQEDIDNATKQINDAIDALTKKDDGNNGGNGNGGNEGNGNNGNGSNSNNGTGNNNQNTNTNQNKANNSNNQSNKNNTSNKDNLPLTGDHTTNGLLAGLSMIGLSAIAWIKRKRKA